MADNFSLDDILAEIDAKKSVKSDSGSSSEKISITSIIGSDNLEDVLLNDNKKSKKPTDDISDKRDNVQLKKPEKTAPAESAAAKRTPALKKPEASKENKESIKPSTASSREASSPKPDKPHKNHKEPQSEEIRPKPQPKKTEAAEIKESSTSAEAKQGKEKNKPKLDFFSAIARKLSDMPFDEEDEDKPLFLDENEQAEPEPPAKLPEKEKKEKKENELINRQLEVEEKLEAPEDLIDSLNPVDLKTKVQKSEPSLSGDTQGIAGNELKALAEKSASPKAHDEKIKLYQTSTDLGNLMTNALAEEKNTSLEPTVESLPPVKEYIPQKEKEKEAEQKTKASELSEKEKRSNEALLDKLNSALSKQHQKEEEKRRTLGLSGPLNGSSVLKAPTNGLNLNKDKIIQATGVIPEIEKESKENSKRKLRDFMMDKEEEEEQQEDFESYDSTGQIWSDLCESHKVIKLRLFILLAISLFMGFVALMGDLNNGMVFKLFGANITFLDRRENVQGFLFYNLVMGIIAAGICGSVLSGGIAKLFRLKADCDSICAVTTITAVLTGAANLINSDSILMSKAYVLIPAAIFGLMFNTLGKLMMITRAKRNFRFISGDSAKYSAVLVDEQPASALTKGVVNELPCLAAMRKTELLVDFLKSSYCEDRADRISRKLVPAGLGVSLFSAVTAFLLPFGTEGLSQNIYYALTVFTAVLSVIAPFSAMFTVNVPLTRAGKSLAKSDSVVLGYQAAEDFSEVNSVMTDASLLFPPGTVIYTNIKHYKQPNSVNNIALDQAIILAASLAIKSGSVMSNMFKNMINDKEDILVKVENCVYEDNLGVLGWYGNKRMMMGGRELMKRHDVKLPDMKKYSKYVTDSTDTIFLSVGGEIVIMFFVELLPNQEIKSSLQQLTQNGVSVVIKTTDSIVTVSKISEIFDISPEMIKILPYSMHEQFNAFTHYVPKGSGAVSCSGTFTGFSKAILASKKLMKDISIGCWTMILGAVLGAVCATAAAWTGNVQLLCPSILIGWNTLWLILTVIIESIRRY